MPKPKGVRHPDSWMVGPYPEKNKLHMDFLRARCQARYRKEEWTLLLEDYIDLWMKDDNYLNKGRGRENVCLTRKDPDLAWSKDNVCIITRAEHFKLCGERTRVRS
jgi:hypothetical protein